MEEKSVTTVIMEVHDWCLQQISYTLHYIIYIAYKNWLKVF
jgi:hypothetical protein